MAPGTQEFPWDDLQMPTVTTPQGIEIAFDSFGNPDDPAILLIMGFGAQSIAWADGFCELLADADRFVIRYDNRDCGLSSTIPVGDLDLAGIMEAVSEGRFDRAREIAPYLLSDMATDAVGLLGALGIDRAPRPRPSKP